MLILAQELAFCPSCEVPVNPHLMPLPASCSDGEGDTAGVGMAFGCLVVMQLLGIPVYQQHCGNCGPSACPLTRPETYSRIPD